MNNHNQNKVAPKKYIYIPDRTTWAEVLRGRKHKSSFGRLVLHVAQTQCNPLTTVLTSALDSIQFKEWRFPISILRNWFFRRVCLLKKGQDWGGTSSTAHTFMPCVHIIVERSILHSTEQRCPHFVYLVSVCPEWSWLGTFYSFLAWLTSCENIPICELPTPSHLLLAPVSL